MKIFLREILPSLLAILFIAVIWRGILSMTFQGEGFVYFDEATYYFSLNDPFNKENYFPVNEDLAARIFSHILSRVFLDDTRGYFAFLFSEMLVTLLSFYWVVRLLSKNRLAAFLSTIFLGVSYAANANMWASGGYQYFLQRGILLLPALLSLLLLIKFLQTNLLIFYLFSVSLYLLTVFLGFFATNFLPVMLLYPIVYLIMNFRLKISFLIKMILIPLPFLMGTYQIIKTAGTLTNNTPQGTHFLVTFIKIIIDVPSNISGFLQQLAVLTVPFFWDANLFSLIRKFFKLRVTDNQNLIWAQIAGTLIFCSAFIYLWKTRPSFRMATLFSGVGFMVLLYLNLFLNKAQSLAAFDSSRYFYYPYSMGAIFWGLFLAGVILRENGIFKKFFMGVFLIWIGYNIFVIERNNKEEGWRHIANKDMVNKIKEWSPVLKEKPYYVYFPGSGNTFGQGGLNFTQRFYAHPKSSFDFNEPDLPTLIKQNIQPEDIFVFRFDYQTHKVLDETKMWRAELVKFR